MHYDPLNDDNYVPKDVPAGDLFRVTDYLVHAWKMQPCYAAPFQHEEPLYVQTPDIVVGLGKYVKSGCDGTFYHVMSRFGPVWVDPVSLAFLVKVNK